MANKKNLNYILQIMGNVSIMIIVIKSLKYELEGGYLKITTSQVTNETLNHERTWDRDEGMDSRNRLWNPYYGMHVREKNLFFFITYDLGN